MNIGDITVIISILAGMAAIPFAASTVSVADDYKYGLAAVLNSTPDFAANSSSAIPSLISKTVSDEGIKYSYRTPYGEYVILISPEKFEETLLKAGKKVSALQSSSEQVWELSLPSESLVINHSSQKIIETYRNLDGYLRITKENGWTSQDKSGTASETELQSGMLNLEKEMNQTILMMKYMSGKILNAMPETPAAQTQSVVINEFMSTPNTTAGESEWIELYNPTGSAISLSGWSIADNTTAEAVLSGTIPAFGYLVLNKSAGDFTFALNENGDMIKLKSESSLIDSVTYGTWNDGNTADNAPAPLEGQTSGRSPNGIDTGIDSADFVRYATPSPGAANT